MRPLPRSVVFFATDSGSEPVHEWLKELNKQEKKIIGEDIKTAQWSPVWKKPLVDFLGDGHWEIRSTLSNTIARVLFFETEGCMVLVHGFKKKTQKTPHEALSLAKMRKKQYESEARKK
jgi:phage-related protein